MLNAFEAWVVSCCEATYKGEPSCLRAKWSAYCAIWCCVVGTWWRTPRLVPVLWWTRNEGKTATKSGVTLKKNMKEESISILSRRWALHRGKKVCVSCCRVVWSPSCPVSWSASESWRLGSVNAWVESDIVLYESGRSAPVCAYPVFCILICVFLVWRHWRSQSLLSWRH